VARTCKTGDGSLNYTLVPAVLAENEVSVTSLVPTLIMGLVGNVVLPRFSANPDGTTHGTRGVSRGAMDEKKI
jgi:hypothetical protein